MRSDRRFVCQDEDSPALLKTARMDEEGRVLASDAGAEGAVELTKEGMAEAQRRYPLLLVNFYAPWCPWSQRMAPVWEATARQLHELYSPSQDGRLLLAKVDCTRAMDLCRMLLDVSLRVHNIFLLLYAYSIFTNKQVSVSFPHI